jgi:hypothetical protein
MLVRCVVFALALAAVVLAEKTISVRTLIPAPEDCSTKVENGDHVWIEHKGFYNEQLMDQNIEGEPLLVKMGKHSIIKGA